MGTHRIKQHPVHQHLLAYRNGRWAWLAAALCLAAIVLYLTQATGTQGAGGSTWQGYVLGSGAAVLVLWLAMLGVRKRSYRSTLGTVEGWVSAHVYLGIATIVLATLHSAFSLGVNLHSLVWGLLVVVVLSGLYGVHAYLRFPAMVSRTRAGQSRDDIVGQLCDLDLQARAAGNKAGGEVAGVVISAIERTMVGGSRLQRLLGRDGSRVQLPVQENGSTQLRLVPNVDQIAVIDYLALQMSRSPSGEQAARLRDLVRLMSARRGLLRRLRVEARLRGLMQTWLSVHVPCTIALLAGLCLHILSVFYFW